MRGGGGLFFWFHARAHIEDSLQGALKSKLTLSIWYFLKLAWQLAQVLNYVHWSLVLPVFLFPGFVFVLCRIVSHTDVMREWGKLAYRNRASWFIRLRSQSCSQDLLNAALIHVVAMPLYAPCFRGKWGTCTSVWGGVLVRPCAAQQWHKCTHHWNA